MEMNTFPYNSHVDGTNMYAFGQTHSLNVNPLSFDAHILYAAHCPELHQRNWTFENSKMKPNFVAIAICEVHSGLAVAVGYTVWSMYVWELLSP